MWKKSFLAFTVIFTTILLQANFSHGEWIEAHSRPAVSKNSPVDHTYACVDRDCYSVNGGTTYGGVAVIQEYVTKRKAALSRCYSGCYFVYAKNGVCHQHTNRILYQTGKTIPLSVRGYSASRWTYGITGDVGTTEGRFSACLERWGK